MNSAILLTFIRLPFVIKIFVLSTMFEWPFYTGFTVGPYKQLLCDWRESSLLIGLICLHKSPCLSENRSELAYKLILHENQLNLVSRS